MFRSPLKKKARRSGFGDYRAFKFSVYAMTNEFFPDLRTVRLDEPGGAVVILDQTRLPGEETYVELRTPEQIWEAIHELKVRGAPAIGVTAAYGIYVCCRRAGGSCFDDLCETFDRTAAYLASSRPTAVNLSAALERMRNCLLAHRDEPAAGIWDRLRDEAEAIRREDAAACRQIGEYGLSLLEPRSGDSDALQRRNIWRRRSTGPRWLPSIWGRSGATAFGSMPMRRVLCCKGARLTSYELMRAGIDVTLICDNMASLVMSEGRVQAVLVGLRPYRQRTATRPTRSARRRRRAGPPLRHPVLCARADIDDRCGLSDRRLHPDRAARSGRSDRGPLCATHGAP